MRGGGLLGGRFPFTGLNNESDNILSCLAWLRVYRHEAHQYHRMVMALGTGSVLASSGTLPNTYPCRFGTILYSSLTMYPSHQQENECTQAAIAYIKKHYPNENEQPERKERTLAQHQRKEEAH